MYLLMILWFVIDGGLLLILLVRKRITKYQNKMRQRFIERVKSPGERLEDILTEMGLIILLGVLAFIIICFIPNILIQKFLEWYKGIFIVALFPALFSWIKEKIEYQVCNDGLFWCSGSPF